VAKNQSLPVPWRFNTGASALGISIDAQLCWVGNEAGDVFALDHQGRVKKRLKLPGTVKCIVRDQHWVYAGCGDGNVYDLTGSIPRKAYTVERNVDIFWVDIHDGLLVAADAAGVVATFNSEEEEVWRKKSPGTEGWMARVDAGAVYVGHSKGVTCYDRVTGKARWSRKTVGKVGFGWQEVDAVYASDSREPYTLPCKVYRFGKDGKGQTVYPCDEWLCSCATSPGGKQVFAGGSYGDIYCFDAQGKRLWKWATECGAAQSMQYFEGKLYVVTQEGYLACVDASAEALARAKQSKLPKTRTLKAGRSRAVAAGTQVKLTRSSKGKVVLECYREGSRLRMRVVSPGYHADWHVQFPRDLREEGACFVVDQVLPAQSGTFYRHLGEILRLKT
jgi:outer membrane protein assembly factor BamB